MFLKEIHDESDSYLYENHTSKFVIFLNKNNITKFLNLFFIGKAVKRPLHLQCFWELKVKLKQQVRRFLKRFFY